MLKYINIVENELFLSEQIITYIGNKRKLLKHIEEEIQNILTEMGSEKVVTCDIFSGSGIVARLLKKYSSTIHTNDLEQYSCLINDCYLTNQQDFDEKLYEEYLEQILSDPLIERFCDRKLCTKR